MNVLITSAGRRVTLLKAFMDAARNRSAKIIAADRDSLAPALYFADENFILPSINDSKYLDELLRSVVKFDIKAIIPTIDTELILLSTLRDKFKEFGCSIIISDHALIDTLRDKYKTEIFLKQFNIDTPKSWTPEMLPCDLPERVFVKPRNGSSSINTFSIYSIELESILPRVPFPIIQELLIGKEITIDALFNLNGQPLHFVPRIRVKTVGGESIQGLTIPCEEFKSWIEKLLIILGENGARGPITLQAFLTDRGPVLTEINPRFGGGFPLALEAGANYPELIFQMLEGKSVVPKLGSYQSGIYMSRYLCEVFTRSPLPL